MASPNSIDMSFSKPQVFVMDRETWYAAVPGAHIREIVTMRNCYTLPTKLTSVDIANFGINTGV